MNSNDIIPKIIELIKSKKGVSFKEIDKINPFGVGTTLRQLDQLRWDGLIHKKRIGTETYYYSGVEK